MTGRNTILTGEFKPGQHHLNKSNSIVVSSFVDHDMLMRYHWGLGIGHQYAHTTASIESQFSSHSLKSHSNGRDMEDYRHLADEVNEDNDSVADATPTVEPDSESDEQSDSESILGDHVDMYGGPDLDPSTEFYEF